MLFNNNYVKENSEQIAPDAIDIITTDGADGETLEDIAAAELNSIYTVGAMESMTYFEGGETAQKSLMESAAVEAMLEARKMSKRTFVRLSKNDDLTRRQHLASIILAKHAKDPLYNKLAINRVHERKLRDAIFTKYKSKALIVAKKSQVMHIKNATPLPKIKLY